MTICGTKKKKKTNDSYYNKHRHILLNILQQKPEYNHDKQALVYQFNVNRVISEPFLFLSLEPPTFESYRSTIYTGPSKVQTRLLPFRVQLEFNTFEKHTKLTSGMAWYGLKHPYTLHLI